MRAEAEKKLEKIRRTSRVLRRVCQVLLVVFGAIFLASVVASITGWTSEVHAFDISLSLRSLALRQRLIVTACVVLMMSVLFKGLYHLQALFGSYARGEIFTTGAAGQIRQLGFTALLWAGANILWIAVTSVLITMHGPRSFKFHPDSVVIGVVVIVISWFMDMAAEMHEENELTI